MKHKRTFILLFLMIFISTSAFLIYKNTYKEELDYVAIGDSLAAGRNPYGADDYGYTDYIRDYLKKENKLKSYVNYAVSGYETGDVISDINYNKTIEVDNENINIRKALRESDLVTISVGANDFFADISLSTLSFALSDKSLIIKEIDETVLKMEELLGLVKKYAKGDIIVIGYYNPLPSLTKYKNEIDEVIKYVDVQYGRICAQEDINYVEISSVMASNNAYLPNPLDIHPNKLGYEAISKEVIKTLEKSVFK